MEVVILPGSKQIASLAADAVEALIRRKPDAVLGLATGSSPLPIYDELALRHERDGLDFSQAQRLRPGRVRGPARRPPGVLPRGDPHANSPHG